MANHYFKLNFGTNLDKTAALNIANPNPGLGNNEVKAAMDEIIALNIIDFKAGDPISRKSAMIVTKTEKEYKLA